MLLALLILGGQAAHADRVELSADTPRIDLDQGQLSYFRDPTTKRTVAEARAAYREQGFQALPGNLGLGFTGDAVWLAVEVTRPADAPTDWVLALEPPTLDLVELYQFHGEQMQRQISGDGLPVAHRALFHRTPAFALQLQQGQTLLLLRIKTSSQVTAIPVLSQRAAFEQTQVMSSLVFGLFFGAMVLVLLYNLVIALLIRQSIYLLYCGYILLQTLSWFSYDGLLGLYLLPDNPLLANQLLGGFLSLHIALSIYFYARLLKVERRHRFSRMLLLYCYLAGSVGSVSVFFGLFHWVLPWIMAAVVLSFPALAPHAVRFIRSGGRVEQIFGGIYLLFAFMVLNDVLASFSLLPASLWSAYSAQIGQLIHVLALHLALYYQVRLGERQRDEAHIKLEIARHDAEEERSRRREQDQLLQMIGHEVRTPIAIIVSTLESLQLMEQEANDDPDKALRYQRIQRAVQRMEILMQLVGVNARALREDAYQIRIESVDLRRLCRSALDLLVEGAERITLDLPPDWSPQVRADAQMLSFAVLNLYDNALKYSLTPEGIEADLHPLRQGDRDGVCLRICNPASPLAAGMEERIFEKFVRIDEHANQPGLGLGLHLARRIVEQQQGWLKARNAGTNRVCFELWLPIDSGGEA
ncbi:sensor histidine kinase [Magnetovirga frankeli]|uniref:sensor histidine kinase n=1 Tax=Magnetovirga frankeli TaxID=947516 RepID=UPI001AF5FAB3|nr:sensor histidine kinase [gamma proteobacterium SS-5]